MSVEELTAELTAFCRAKLLDAEWVNQTDVERVLESLAKAGEACVDREQWDWVPPQVATGPRQGVLF